MLGEPYCLSEVPLVGIYFVGGTLSYPPTLSKFKSFHWPLLPCVLSLGFPVSILMPQVLPRESQGHPLGSYGSWVGPSRGLPRMAVDVVAVVAVVVVAAVAVFTLNEISWFKFLDVH